MSIFMKRVNLWILAAVFCCSLVMNSCSDGTVMPDNPVPAPEQASKSQSLLEDVYIMRTARQNLLKAIAGKSRTEESFTASIMSPDGWLGDLYRKPADRIKIW